MSVEGNEKQGKVGNTDRCRTVSQRAVPASAIIFHQAKKQFAALKLENKSSPISGVKTGTDVRIAVKPMGIEPMQGYPAFQNKIPILKISPSLNTVITPKYADGRVIRAKVPMKVTAHGGKTYAPDSPKKTGTNGAVIKVPRSSNLTGVRVKTTQSPLQQKHGLSQNVTSPSKGAVRTVNTPVTLRTKPCVSYVSSNVASSASSTHPKSETRAGAQKETEKKRTGAIKVISVNALNARQPKTVSTENVPNKPLRLAPSISRANPTRKTEQHSSSNIKSSPIKPFTSVTNLVSNEKFGKPVSFVASSVNQGNSYTKRI
ncbi:unnamed protein product [Pneumocystis jirovecii]|uniref:Uncharacterized protein n=1 Tax=Pneumocystis jirovecii TaxID=42068 RepID=L0PE91_PNEJI|nr:unnamed protein product [Pneumocystis jirovecii]